MIIVLLFQKNPFPPHRKSLEIPRGGGVLKAIFVEAMYENKLEFPGRGGGCKTINPKFHGGVWLFSGNAQSSKNVRRSDNRQVRLPKFL